MFLEGQRYYIYALFKFLSRKDECKFYKKVYCYIENMARISGYGVWSHTYFHK